MCFRYIIVSSVPVSDRGAEISEGAKKGNSTFSLLQIVAVIRYFQIRNNSPNLLNLLQSPF